MLFRVFVLTFLSLVASTVALAERRIALVIGNGAYEHMRFLPNPSNDARLMQEALESVGFEVHVEFNADEDFMEDAFRDHGDRLASAGEDAVGLVFFAGHGVQVDGLNFLLPVDAEIYSTADVYGEAPRLADLFRHLERAGNRTNFIILDACRNNNLPASYRGEDGLAREGRVTGTFIAYATQPGAVAADGAGENSPFTSVLASLIAQPGVPAESMFRRVATRVQTLTEGRQQPWSESGLVGENDFCFGGCQSEAGSGQGLVESRALQNAFLSDDVEEMRAFLGRFPNSDFRFMVEREIERLSTGFGSQTPGRVPADVRSADSQTALDNSSLAWTAIPESQGTVTLPTSTFVNEMGWECRTFEESYVSRGETVDDEYTACQNPTTGEWEIES